MCGVRVQRIPKWSESEDDSGDRYANNDDDGRVLVFSLAAGTGNQIQDNLPI